MPRPTAPAVLILAGLDPSGGAGLLADAEAVRAAGGRPLCVATALTVQTRARARSFQPCAPSFLLESARALLEEEDVRAIKIGMLGTPQLARAIGDLLGEFPALPAVLDPVVAASSGALLFKGTPGDARLAVMGLSVRALLTPNLPEACLLLGLPPPGPEAGAEAQEALARALVEAGAKACVVKGGHASGDEAVDVLATLKDGAVTHARLAGPRLPGTARGTGCRFASALATGLARGEDPLQAALAAKKLVAAYLREAGRGGPA